MSNTRGYMVTWTTYGSWLQGNKRGFVKKGQVLGESKGLEQANRRKLTGDCIKLSKEQREIIRKAISLEAERIAEKIVALSVGSNHVHIVIGEGGNSIDKVVSRLKNAAYYALLEYGFEGQLWTRGYDKRFCYDDRAMKNRTAYVTKQRGRKKRRWAGV